MLNKGNKSEAICRVCGYDDGSIRWEAEDGELYPSYLICECCGSESGYYDTIIKAIRSNREKWVNNGAKWKHLRSKPQEWDLEKQLAQIPDEYK